MGQETRNKIYGVVAGVVGVAVVLGLVDNATSDEALSLTNQVLETGSQVLALAGVVLAFFKSLPGKTTTLDVPKAEVDTVNKVSGAVVAVDGTLVEPADAPIQRADGSAF